MQDGTNADKQLRRWFFFENDLISWKQNLANDWQTKPSDLNPVDYKNMGLNRTIAPQ